MELGATLLRVAPRGMALPSEGLDFKIVLKMGYFLLNFVQRVIFVKFSSKLRRCGSGIWPRRRAPTRVARGGGRRDRGMKYARDPLSIRHPTVYLAAST